MCGGFRSWVRRPWIQGCGSLKFQLLKNIDPRMWRFHILGYGGFRSQGTEVLNHTTWKLHTLGNGRHISWGVQSRQHLLGCEGLRLLDMKTTETTVQMTDPWVGLGLEATDHIQATETTETFFFSTMQLSVSCLTALGRQVPQAFVACVSSW